mmetsp:Transcript_75781/g.120083  ORF Transcript_75781/g.120083 Transcript_75781/m.120083 type:complete len:220 (+) Transcript_75781:2161-2820(+)
MRLVLFSHLPKPVRILWAFLVLRHIFQQELLERQADLFHQTFLDVRALGQALVHQIVQSFRYVLLIQIIAETKGVVHTALLLCGGGFLGLRHAAGAGLQRGCQALGKGWRLRVALGRRRARAAAGAHLAVLHRPLCSHAGLNAHGLVRLIVQEFWIVLVQCWVCAVVVHHVVAEEIFALLFVLRKILLTHEVIFRHLLAVEVPVSHGAMDDELQRSIPF